MRYVRLENTRDADLPYLLSLYRLPEISRFIHIDEAHYWDYVTTDKNVFYYKVYRDELLAAAIHCELAEGNLYMDIVVFPEYQKLGIGSEILRDIQRGAVLDGFERIEVSIDESNAASIRLFEKMGFAPVLQEDELIRYRYEM